MTSDDQIAPRHLIARANRIAALKLRGNASTLFAPVDSLFDALLQVQI